MEENKSQLAEKQWYIVTTYSSHEDKVAENIRNRIQSMNLTDKVFRVVVANQEIPVLDKDGKPKKKVDKKTGQIIDVPPKIKNLYPGYIFIEMIMTDDSWFMVRNTQGVTGIAGSSGGGQKPTPVGAREMETVLKKVGIVDKSMYDQYNIGDEVKIINGAFENVEGEITAIDKENGKVTVDTVFFGKHTPVELEFSEIAKSLKK
jgi:transcription termination/antitermination protein NusG